MYMSDRDFCVGDPTQPIFHWLALGFCIRPNTNFKFCVGGDKFKGWLKDTNMLVSPTQNSGVRGSAQCQPLTPGILRRIGI